MYTFFTQYSFFLWVQYYSMEYLSLLNTVPVAAMSWVLFLCSILYSASYLTSNLVFPKKTILLHIPIISSKIIIHVKYPSICWLEFLHVVSTFYDIMLPKTWYFILAPWKSFMHMASTYSKMSQFCKYITPL